MVWFVDLIRHDQDGTTGGAMKNTRILITLGTWTALLSGCVTVEEVYSPEGEKAHLIDCSTTKMAVFNWGHCEKKASDICQARGYDVISRNSDSNESGGGAVGGSGGVFGGNYSYGANVSRTMMIRCRGEEPDEPAEKKKWRKLG